MSGWWTASYVVLWILVLALGAAVVALARQIGVLHLRLGPRGALEVDDEGPPLGEAPEPLEAHDLRGRPVTVGGPGPERFLLFVSPGCPICREVLPSVRAVARAERLSPLVLADADEEESVVAYGGRDLGGPVVADPPVAEAYAVPGTPYAVVLDRSGVVRAKGTVNNLEQVEGLVSTARRRMRELPPAVGIG